jgi:hypothetical protein
MDLKYLASNTNSNPFADTAYLYTAIRCYEVGRNRFQRVILNSIFKILIRRVIIKEKLPSDVY